MPMLPDLLKQLVLISGRQHYPDNNDTAMSKSAEDLTQDKNITHPNEGPMAFKPPADAVYDDSGKFSLDQTPFAGLKDMIGKSRAGDNSGPGVLRQLLGSLLQGQMVPHTGTVGGDPAGVSKPDHVPGTRQDAVLNPTPLKDQSQPNFALPPRHDYAQPTALDPAAIEQLRQSLLSDSGQLDPSNPNGLSGRMNDPNSQIDMQNQRRESQSIEDSVRGFDGSRKANIQKGNQ